MSKTIDERVVEMRFDNKQFESGISKSLISLDKLKEKLNLNGATKGLKSIETAAKSINLTTLSDAVDTVKVKFSALEIMAVAALTNITNSVVNTGKQMLNSLTLEPIMTGFQEYETQINAVQTILANTSSKGTTLDQVNAALDQLNHYADMTIYNFTEMTRNIGTFTAAGVDLDTSVSAIKGIANLAAVSGSTSQQASTAMYQLSQALAAGTVQLMDWNSVVNAGMGGQVFQDALIRTSELLGTGAKEAINTYGSFRESLTKGAWLTTNVLTETLKQFAGAYSEAELIQQGFTEEQARSIADMADTAVNAATKVKTFTQLFDTLKEAAQSGWTQSWEIIVGDFEEAKELLTKVSDVVSGIINAQSDARNALLQGWKDLGGRTDIIDGLTNAFVALRGAVAHVSYVFRKVFPPTTSEQLKNISEKFKTFTEKLELSSDSAMVLKKNFKGLFSIFDIARRAFSAIVTAMSPLFTKILALGGSFFSLTGEIGYAIYQFDLFLKRSGSFKKIGDAVAKGINQIIKVAEKAIEYLKPIVEEIGNRLKALKDKLTANDFEKIKEVLSKIHSIVIKLGKSAILYLKEASDKLTDFIKSSGALEKVRVEFSKIINYIKNIINRLKKINSIDDVVAIFKDVKNDAIDYFSEKVSKLGDLFSNLKVSMAEFKDSVVLHLKTAGEGVDSFKGKMANLISFLGTKFDNIGFGEVFTVALGVGMVKSIKKLEEALSKLAKPLKSISDIADKFGGVLTGVQNILKAYTMQIKSKALLNIAIAIGILAASIALLSLIDTAKLWGAIGALAALSALLVGLSAAMGAISKVGGVSFKGIASIAGMAASLLILTISLEMLDGLNPNRIWSNIAVLAALAVGLSALCVTLSRLAPQMSKGSIAMIVVSIAISKMVKTLKEIDQLKIDNPGQTASIIVGIAASLAIMSKACSSVSFGSAVGMLAVVASLKLFISVFESFAKMDIDNLKNTIKSFTAIMVLFSGLIVATKFAGDNAIKAGVAILAISGSLVLLMAAFKIMASMSGDEIKRATSAVSQLIVAFGMVVALSNFAGENAAKAGVMLLMMSASLTILAGVMVVLAHIDPDGLSRAVTAIAVLEFMFAGLIAVTKLAEDCKSTLITLASVIAVLAVSLGALSMINSDNIKSASTSLALVMGMLSLIIASTKLAKGAEVALGIVVIVIGAIGGVLYAIANLPTGTAIPAAEALSILLISMSASLAILSKVKNVSLNALGAMAALTLIVAGLAAILGYLASMNLGSTLDTAESLSVLLLSLSAACSVLALVGLAGPAAFVGIGALATLVVGIGSLMAGIGALVTYFPNLELFVTKGISLLNSIGYGIGSFLGSTISGFLTGSTSGMPEMAENLSDFMEKIQPFCEGAATLTTDSLDGVKNLSTAIKSLSNANLMDSISSFFSGGRSFSEFASQLSPLGTAIKEFSNSVDGIDEGDVTTSAACGKMLAEMAATLPNSGGVIGWFTGDNDIGAFGDQLVPFGKAMKKYSDAVTGLDEGAVSCSASAGKTLAELANNLPNSGGLSGWFFGENDLDNFGSKLLSFGRAIKQYSNVVTGLDADAVNASASAGSALAELANNLPNSGGVISKWFFGEKDIASFGSKLLSFGRAIKQYSYVVTGLNADAVNASATAGKSLSELANNLPNSGGKVSKWFSGEKDLATFGNQLISFGSAMKDYAEKVTGLDADVVTNSANAAKALVELSNNLPSGKGIFSWCTGENDIESFGKQIKSFGKSMSEYYADISEIETSQLSSATTEFGNLMNLATAAKDIDTSGLSSFATNLTNLGNSGIDAFINAFTNSSSRVSEAADLMITTFISAVEGKNSTVSSTFTTLITGILTVFTNKYQSFETTGVTLMTNFIGGVKSSTANAQSAFANIISACLTVIKNKYAEFKSVGQSTMTNFISGAKSNTSTAQSAFANIISACLTSIKNKYSEFRTVGQTTLSNYISGVKSKQSNAQNAFTDILSACITSIQNKRSDFRSVGKSVIQSLSDGVNDKKWDFKDTAVDVMSKAVEAMRDKHDDYYDVGRYFVDGVSDGIKDNAYKVNAAAREMARKAAEAARNELDINSPSKVGYSIGNFFGMGFVNAMVDYSDKTYDAGSEMAKSAKEGLRNTVSKIGDYIQNGIDSQPTIRPVLDLSEVSAGAGRLSALLSRSQALRISTSLERETSRGKPGDETSTSTTNSYNFTQNNYSPKALSRTEIYRQTKNQFSAMERMVEI